jgi:hypothetical protein
MDGERKKPSVAMQMFNIVCTVIGVAAGFGIMRGLGYTGAIAGALLGALGGIAGAVVAWLITQLLLQGRK